MTPDFKERPEEDVRASKSNDQSHSQLQRAIKVTPSLTISLDEFQSYRSSPQKLNDFLSLIGEEYASEGFLRWLGRKNNNRSLELIRTDIYIALNKLIENFDLRAETSFHSYVQNLLVRKVVDIWREENEKKGLKRVDVESLESIQDLESGPLAQIEGMDLCQYFFSKLSDVEKSIVELRMEGYRFKEISNKLGENESALYRSLGEIKDIVRGDLNHPYVTNPEGPISEQFQQLLEIESLKAQIAPFAKSLNEISDINSLAAILGVKPEERAVAKACVSLGLLDGDANPATPILREDGSLSLQLDPSVRSRALVLKDLKSIIQHQNLSCDQLTKITPLSEILKCSPSEEAIYQKLVLAKLVTPPAIHELENDGELNPLLDKRKMSYGLWRFNMRAYLKSKFETLDDFSRSEFLAEALNCKNTKLDICRAAINQQVFPWRAPDSYSLFGKRSSMYVSRYVLGSEGRVIENIAVGIKETIKNLDDVRQNEALSTALRCPKNSTAIAAALVRNGILGGVLPDGHPFSVGQVRSNYFDPAVVGEVTVRANILRFLQREAPTLDDLPMIDSLCTTLGVERRRWALAKYVVKENLIDWRIPPFHDIQIAQGSLYLNKEVMSKEQINFNLRIIFNSTYDGNLDNLPGKSKSLSSALGVANNKGAIAKELVARKIASPMPPHGYDHTSKRQSVYTRGFVKP